MDTLKVALIQMPVVTDKAANLQRAEAALRQAAAEGAQLAVLPEMWNTPYDTAVFADYAEDPEGASCTLLRRVARETGMVVVGGSIAEKDAQDRIYNTCFVYDESGALLAFHRKRHLFDIDVPGGQYFKESDVLTPGACSTTFTALGWTFGVGICFDMRFPEQAADMCAAGAECLIYPAAFNPTTGPMHWSLLLRARAMDAQAWTLACAPVRRVDSGYTSWAHSMVVNPWATIEHDLGTEAGLRLARIDKSSLQAVRTQIPLQEARR